jgi:hypothetical protein
MAPVKATQVLGVGEPFYVLVTMRNIYMEGLCSPPIIGWK